VALFFFPFFGLAFLRPRSAHHTELPVFVSLSQKKQMYAEHSLSYPKSSESVSSPNDKLFHSIDIQFKHASVVKLQMAGSGSGDTLYSSTGSYSTFCNRASNKEYCYSTTGIMACLQIAWNVKIPQHPNHTTPSKLTINTYKRHITGLPTGPQNDSYCLKLCSLSCMLNTSTALHTNYCILWIWKSTCTAIFRGCVHWQTEVCCLKKWWKSV